MSVSNDISGTVFGNVIQARDVRLEASVVVPVIELDLREQPVFEGREEELAELAEILEPGSGVGVVAVSGLAGVGKTALANRAAQAAVTAGWFPGGVLTVDLRGYGSVDRHVPSSAALVSLLGSVGFESAQIPTDMAGQERLWRKVLTERASAGQGTLVILDNVSDDDTVLPFLPGSGCASHRVMVTSRNSLSTLQGARLIDLELLSDEQATELLLKELATGRKNDRRVEDRDAATGIARLCGGLPLAIRVCAALLIAEPDLPLRDLADELQDEQHRLEGLDFDGSLAVRCAFELSHESLTAPQRRAFRLVALNPAPTVTAQAAAALTAMEVPAVRRVIRQLVRAHLVMPAGRDQWQMHDLVRLYANELNDAADDQEDAVTRLFDYYRDNAVSASVYLDPRIPAPEVDGRFADREDALDWMEREYPSLVGAVGLAGRLENHHNAYQLASALTRYFELGKHWHNWVRTAEIAMTAARELDDQGMIRTALTQYGNASRALGDLDRALACHEQALAISLEMGDLKAEGHCFTVLANTHLALGSTDQAISCNKESLRIRQDLGDLYGQRVTLNHLGNAYLRAGRTETAVTCYEDALEINAELGDPLGESRTLTNLGAAYQRQGRLNDALTCFERDLVVVRGMRDRYGEATTLLNLGNAYLELEDLDEAEEFLSQAAEIFQDLGSRCGTEVAQAGLDAIRRATSTAPEGRSYDVVVPLDMDIGDSFRRHLHTADCAASCPEPPR